MSIPALDIWTLRVTAWKHWLARAICDVHGLSVQMHMWTTWMRSSNLIGFSKNIRSLGLLHHMTALAWLSSQVSLEVAGLTMLNIIHDNTGSHVKTRYTVWQVYTGLKPQVTRMWGNMDERNTIKDKILVESQFSLRAQHGTCEA